MLRPLYNVALLLALIAVTCFTGADSECKQAALAGCIAPISSSMGNNSMISSGSLGDVCGKLDTASQCVSSQDCSNSDPYVVIMWEGLHDSVDYLCTDSSAKDAITQADDKITSPAVKQQMMTCNQVFMDALVNDSSKTISAVCPIYNNMLECMANASATCGGNAQKVVVTFMYKFLSPQARLVKCKLRDPSTLTSGSLSSRTPSLVTIVVGLVGIAVWHGASKRN